MKTAIDKLTYLCDTVPDKLRRISEAGFSAKPLPTKWSKKEMLGHLIDSAANNHQRFIRAQFEDSPLIWYDQDNWVRYSEYQRMPLEQLIDFWELYNRHLIFLLSWIPNESLGCMCTMKDGSRLTLGFLITDYVAHLEHHLRQLV